MDSKSVPKPDDREMTEIILDPHRLQRSASSAARDGESCDGVTRARLTNEDDATTSDTNAEPLEHRVIFINRQQPNKFCNNRISTAKYNLFTFVPLFLLEQFRRYSNCFFLMIALMQQIPDVSPTGRWTTVTPLTFILTVSAIKEILEDWKRHRADDETNNRLVFVLRPEGWESILWKRLQVGDICKVVDNNFFPADLVLISSSEPNGMSFIETANLDGETNLKIRQALPDTASLLEGSDLQNFQATIDCEPPNKHLYEFNGVIKETNKRGNPLNLDQMLLRGAKLRNTSWIVGIVVYTGHDTKLLKNSNKAPLKRSTVDKLTNTQILLLLVLLFLMSLMSAICSEIWLNRRSLTDWYIGLGEVSSNIAFNFLTFLILYNNLIPISLQVTVEIVRFWQALLISYDLQMYHEETNTPALARTSNLNEELGMVRYIFSDKTGTLTQNIMEFKMCSIAEILYSVSDSKPEDTVFWKNLSANHPKAKVLSEFMTLLAVCHTVIPEKLNTGRFNYIAASPDERALVYGASKFGFEFTTRTPAYVEISILGRIERYEILDVLEFTSTRQRMSVIVRAPNGQLKLYMKGADTAIYKRLSSTGKKYAEITLTHLEQFASEGLRTLAIAVADVSEDFYNEWKNTYHKACSALQNREEKIAEAADLIETNLNLLGATAIEDKLQDGVPETIAMLLRAGIKIWILTGDKQETAINIGYSSKLISQGMPLLILNEDNLDKTRETIGRYTADFGDNIKKVNDVGLIIDGNTLKYALTHDLRKDFLDLCIACKSVICCRVSPIQKADVVELVSMQTDSVTMAVGDGANDVAMIQRASVGVGISGLEGLQAVCASDYSVAQFRFLQRLVLVHGTWNYSRMTKLILYSFYKNICLYVLQFWFQIHSAWSGQVLFERWTIGIYNVAFTALPPFAIGIFDKACTAEAITKHPSLYSPSQEGSIFNVWVFWLWVFNSLFHSIALFWLPKWLIGDGSGIVWSNGREGGILVLGIISYTYTIVTVCLKSGLVTKSWTFVTHFSIWASIFMWIVFLVIYSMVWPTIDLGANISGMGLMVMSSPVFWFGLLLIPTIVLLPDVIFRVIRNTMCRGPLEILRLNETRKSDPEIVLDTQPRHSLTETARLLKNVKSVFSRRANTRVNMDVELSHGFAFSQEEGGVVTQSDMIRAYDTNIPKPTGL